MLGFALHCATLKAMAKMQSISIRMDAELRGELEKLAARENRKLSNLVETVLRRYVEAQRRKPQRED
jgi:predicted transcriptional regulator